MQRCGLNFKNFKILTCAVLISTNVAAQVMSEKEFNTYLRWNLSIEKNQVVISKKNPGEINLETLNIDLFNKLVDQLKLYKLPNKYISSFEFDQNGFPQVPAQIKIKLVNQNIEMFSFYKDGDAKLVLDFWTDDALNLAETPKKETPVVKVEEKEPPKKVTPKPVEPKSEIKVVDVKKDFRDFRYGGVFFWNYSGLLPKIEELVSLKDKTPIFFYPIKDREYKKGEKEAHQQLTINLFRKEKFGLMNKSIEIYHQKYGANDDEVEVMFEYLKVNALLKSNIGEDKDNKNIFKTAINLLENLIERNSNPDFKMGLLKYTLQYYYSNKEYIKSLEVAKNLFVIARENIDHETATTAAKFIIYSLSELKQASKLEQFIKDPGVDSLLSRQLHFAYLSYTLLEVGSYDNLIKMYETNEKGLKKPIQPEIIFNVAEAYFRTANYEKALKLFYQFERDYSYMNVVAQVRVRLGLINEIQNDDERVAIALYKDAIDKSTDLVSSLEARIRYVSMRMNRKIAITEEDKETLVFLDFDEREKLAIEKDLKKLLWIVRLRSMINLGEYENALNYLSVIPLNTLPMNDRKIFELDGAEIVYGLMKQEYENAKYSDVIRNWENYKTVYIDKVALDPFINYVVCNSYLRLGLVKTFENLLANLENPWNHKLELIPFG
ncbi:MAG: tetratricopeptide repeat protein [Bacteriovoracaceae bacterium]